MKKILKKILLHLIYKISPTKQEKFIANINYDITKKQRKILLIYLDLPTSSKQVERLCDVKNSGAIHTNRYELFQIIQVLIKLGCCIDVCAHYEEEAIPYIEQKEYDAILGLGTMFRYAINKTSAKKILYLTENPYYISYKREKERIEYFKKRTGMDVALFRTGMFFKENDEDSADAIICMGELKYLKHLDVPVERIFPSAFKNDNFLIEEVHERKKNSFLVLGTDGFIHKGNDLLVEIFNKHPEWELYLCGYKVSETINELGLKLTENIYDCGYIDVKSDKFREVVKICSFILLPSCSEAPSTAILTGMRHGLIPIVMKGNGLDELKDFCFYFEGYQLEKIEGAITKVMQISIGEITRRSQRTYIFANKEFTLNRFTENLYVALERLLTELKV